MNSHGVTNGKLPADEAAPQNGQHESPSHDQNLDEAIPLLRAPNLCMILDTPKGRGVFASAPIPARTVVEISPVLIFTPEENAKHIQKTNLYNYTYVWPTRSRQAEKTQLQALPLGLGAMFNHTSRNSRLNVGWTRDAEKEIVTYTALRDIRKGEELCISYGQGLWFEGKLDEGVSSEEEEDMLGLDRIESGVL